MAENFHKGDVMKMQGVERVLGNDYPYSTQIFYDKDKRYAYYVQKRSDGYYTPIEVKETDSGFKCRVIHDPRDRRRCRLTKDRAVKIIKGFINNKKG